MHTPPRGYREPRTPKFPVITRDEPKTKCPVTQEYLATFIGQNRPCVTLAHTFFPEALHASVTNLIFKLAAKYHVTCSKSEVEDLAQDCWLRIIKKLHTYKADKAKFTTWVYHVCGSVLNKKYQKARKVARWIAEAPEGVHEDRISRDDATTVAANSDFRDTIEEMKEMYPTKSAMIEALFWDPDGDGEGSRVLNHKFVYRRAAQQCGSTAASVSKFFKECVRPFFSERFAGECCHE